MRTGRRTYSIRARGSATTPHRMPDIWLQSFLLPTTAVSLLHRGADHIWIRRALDRWGLAIRRPRRIHQARSGSTAGAPGRRRGGRAALIHPTHYVGETGDVRRSSRSATDRPRLCVRPKRAQCGSRDRRVERDSAVRPAGGRGRLQVVYPGMLSLRDDRYRVPIGLAGLRSICLGSGASSRRVRAFDLRGTGRRARRTGLTPRSGCHEPLKDWAARHIPRARPVRRAPRAHRSQYRAASGGFEGPDP